MEEWHDESLGHLSTSLNSRAASERGSEQWIDFGADFGFDTLLVGPPQLKTGAEQTVQSSSGLRRRRKRKGRPAVASWWWRSVERGRIQRKLGSLVVDLTWSEDSLKSVLLFTLRRISSLMHAELGLICLFLNLKSRIHKMWKSWSEIKTWIDPKIGSGGIMMRHFHWNYVVDTNLWKHKI